MKIVFGIVVMIGGLVSIMFHVPWAKAMMKYYEPGTRHLGYKMMRIGYIVVGLWMIVIGAWVIIRNS